MSGGLLKPEKDFTKDADKLIPEAEDLAKVRPDSLSISKLMLTYMVQTDVQGAVDKLLGLEKQSRQV